jgi:predicted secreted protein
MKKTNLLLAVALAVFTLNAWADLCPKCNKLAFISSIGKCSKCENHTSSGAFKLCKQCSAKTDQCAHCEKPVVAKPIAAPPAGRKPYPKHWGNPPLRQTKDLRALPGGYGAGSSTLASWIQKKLANDARNGIPAPPVLTPGFNPLLKPEVAPPDPVAPPFDPAAEANKNAKADLAKVQAGIKAWEVAKAKCKGNYSYKIGFESWVGFGHETTIVVGNNKVTERRYRTFNRRRPVAPPRPGLQAPQKAEGTSWVEQGKAIGNNKRGAPAKTLDELYVMALETAKKRLRHFERRHVRSDKQGLLISCYIMDRTIADDAPRKGLVISKITLGKSVANPETGQVRPPPRNVGRPAHTPNREQLAGDCALCRTEAHQLHLGLAENGGTITVKLGSVVRVKLRGNPTTGFTWNNATKSNGVKLNGKITHQAGGRPGVLGAGGMSTATFQATKLGKSTIILHYKRVWEKIAPANTVKINIAVTQDGRFKPQPAGNNAARIAELEQEIAKMKDFARRARFSREGLIKFQAKLAKLEKELADLKAGVAKPVAAAALPAKITLKDAQGGVVGFTGWITTVNTDGSWTRSQFINQNVRPASQRGQLSAAQIKSLAETLKTANVQKLPARMGKFHGANPHVITLTCGDHQSVFTLPTGSKLPKGEPNAGPNEAANRFILVASQLAGLKAGAPKPPQKIYRSPNGKAFPAHWGAPPRIQTRDLRPFPGGYGRGSGTLARWIQKNMDADKAKAGGKPQIDQPTFEEWVKGGMKIPAGRVFLGGTPWFDERKGERRTPREVYGMLFGKPKTRR